MLRKRNKEGGFTLIELMIAISVIGILTVVLIPRLGGVKDSAKYAGVLTNAKSVEAYVIGNMDRWVRYQTPDQVRNAIYGQFSKAVATNPDADTIVNPLDSENKGIVVDGIIGPVGIDDLEEGTIEVIVVASDDGKINHIQIIGYGKYLDETNLELIYKSMIGSNV